MNGIERLKEMLKGQKDKYLKIIVNYLINQTEMDEYFLNEEKNLKDMAEYIKKNARKETKGSVAVIEDERVFKWAKDYFVKSNKESEITKNKIENSKSEKASKVTTEDDEFGSIFNCEANKKTEEKIEQISLF